MNEKKMVQESYGKETKQGKIEKLLFLKLPRKNSEK